MVFTPEFRYSLIVDNGEITHKNVEISPAKYNFYFPSFLFASSNAITKKSFDTTSAENILAQAAETKKE